MRQKEAKQNHHLRLFTKQIFCGLPIPFYNEFTQGLGKYMATLYLAYRRKSKQGAFDPSLICRCAFLIAGSMSSNGQYADYKLTQFVCINIMLALIN